MTKVTTQTFNPGDKRVLLTGRKLRIQVTGAQEKDNSKGIVYLKDENGLRITPLIFSLEMSNNNFQFDCIEIFLPDGSPFEYLLDVDFNGWKQVYLSILIYP